MSAVASRLRILVVDDAATVRHWLAARLGGTYEVSVACDGAEAVRVALDATPHLVLLDIEMPRLDGFATCRALRSFVATRNTPIILVTSRTSPSDVEAGYASGCTDFIGKPIEPDELLAKVESWIAATQPFDGSAP